MYLPNVIQGRRVELLDKLAKEFNQDTILFIGSGVSNSAGLPSWRKLVDWLRDYTLGLGGDVEAANAFLHDNDLLKASSALISELEERGKSLSDFFEDDDKCSIFRTAEPQEIHQLIRQLPTSSIITTNYDLLLEKSYGMAGCPIQIVHKGENQLLNSISRSSLKSYLYKYHGCISQPQKIVLDYQHYSSLIHGLSSDMDFLKSLIKTKTFVFIGAGLEDPDFNHIRDYLNEINQPCNLEFWAFMRNCEAKVDYFKKYLGINLINYTGQDSDHSDLLNKLEELLSKIISVDERKREAIELVKPVAQYLERNDDHLRQVLVQANENIIPLDEQILGFVAFFDSVAKKSCFGYLNEYKGYELPDISNRIEYLINRKLLKQTENYLLPVRESYSKEAAEIVEDDIMNYLAELENE